MLYPGMRVYVRLAAHLRGRVGGLCGNFDGDTENDFTTRQGIIESTAELFGNSWKVSPSCPDVADQDLRDPCAVSSNTHIYTLIYRNIKANLQFFFHFAFYCFLHIQAEQIITQLTTAPRELQLTFSNTFYCTVNLTL